LGLGWQFFPTFKKVLGRFHAGLMKIFAIFFHFRHIFQEALWVNFFHTFVLFRADLGKVFGLLHFYFGVPSILSGFFGSKILSSFWVWVW
jgi:hypothetical protein